MTRTVQIGSAGGRPSSSHKDVGFGLGLDKLPDDGIVRDSDGGEDAVNPSGRPSAA